MARQNQTAYEELREKYALYHLYETAIAKGGYPENLPNLAALVAEKEGEEVGEVDGELVQSLKSSTNFPALSRFLEPGIKRFGKDYENFMKENLEQVIDSTPTEELQDNLLYINPKKNGKYQDIAKLHKEAAEMQMNLRAYTSKEAPQELKVKAFEKIQRTSLGYFIEKYKNSQSFLHALINYIQVSPEGEQIILAKYAKITSDKTVEFNDRIKDKVVLYTKEILPKDHAPAFYEMVLKQAA